MDRELKLVLGILGAMVIVLIALNTMALNVDLLSSSLFPARRI